VSRIISFICAVFLAAYCLAQGPSSTLRGEVQAEGLSVETDLLVQLRAPSGSRFVEQTYLRADGSFEFRDVPTGDYTLRVMRADQIVTEQLVTITPLSQPLQIRLPRQTTESSPAGTVSIRQLQNPVSKNALRSFAKAQRYSDAGDHVKAIEELRRTLPDASATGYAHAILSAEYGRMGQTEAAIAESEAAVRVIPDSSALHTNLAFELSIARRFDRAEDEARQAIHLDRYCAKAHYLLGYLLLARGASPDEAIENLKLARNEVPKSKLLLGQFYARNGKRVAAKQELREYLTRATGDDRVKAERWLAELEK
jgi:tetratricopeptide (TPR) repeat protein